MAIDIVSELDIHPDSLQKLWILIISKLISLKEYQKAIHLGTQAQIKLETLLDLFPDFCKIDDIKTPMMQRLQEYQDELQRIELELESNAKNSESIRETIQNSKEMYCTIPIMKSCDLCQRQLLTRPFHIFPCSHGFHGDCLHTRVFFKFILGL
jgi:hypothetical protein